MTKSESLSDLIIDRTVKFMTTLPHRSLTDSIVILDNTPPQCVPECVPDKYPPTTTHLLPNYYFPDLSLFEK